MNADLKWSLLTTVFSLAVVIVFSFTAVLN
ncbi:cytochrome bd-I oxidase subunit CydH [Biostraticola tofi]